MDSATGDGSYFDSSTTEETNNYIFFRWDKRFVINTEKGRGNGVYNEHGHKPEIELIPYNDQFERSFWKIQFEDNHITLELLNADTTIARKFKRIHRFPE